MAFRSQAFAIGIVAAALLAAEPVELEVRHDHVRKNGSGVLRVDDTGLAFTEKDKSGHSRSWSFDDIQQLTLEPGEIRVLGYDDVKWKGGRDREWVFRAPGAEKAISLLRAGLGAKLVAAVADPSVRALWALPAKRKKGFGGPEGVLIVGENSIVFSTKERGEARTWRIEDIENVSSSGAYDVTITTLERGSVLRGGATEFTFQMKRPLSPERYQDLWRRVHRAKGLPILQSIE
jgi:hypothetical protein